MPIGRIILKSISESKKLAKLKTDGARLLYTWLISHLDANGCFYGDPEVINGKVLTRLKKSDTEVEELLRDLEQRDLIIRYQTNDDTFLFVPDFKEKQPYLNPDREGKTRIPKPTHEQLTSKSCTTPSNLGQIEREIEIQIESKSKDVQPPAARFSFKDIWDKFPSKVGRKQAERHFNASVKNQTDWEDINRALENYIRSERVQKGYVQNGSTWFNNWRDWIVSPEAPKKDKSHRTMEKIMRTAEKMEAMEAVR